MFFLGLFVGAAAVGALWWYVDSRLGGVSGVETTIKKDVAAVGDKIGDEVSKVL